MNVSSVSVIVCTFNRAAILRETLACLAALEPPPDCDSEIVVVDNNSTDDTPAVIAEIARTSTIRIVPVRETRQGKGFALNAGLQVARGDVIALSDDDVWVTPEWLSRLVSDFREQEVTFVFGRVLPRWTAAPPPDLLLPRAQAVWGPIAIADYGEEPAVFVPERVNQRNPMGGNLALTRTALEAIGAWRTDLGKPGNSLIMGEDHEIFSRLRRAGEYRGFYDPALRVRHLVTPDRLTRRYFRRWFYWNGRTQALMLPELYFTLDLTRTPHVLGVPRFLYREALGQVWRWLRRVGRRDGLELLIEEMLVVQYAGLFTERWRGHLRRIRRPRRAIVAGAAPQGGL
jgi:glycosyltransferase involved in cell wall biosynthesis